MNTLHQTSHQLINTVRKSTIINSFNNIITWTITSDYFNQFISIILK
jgi:hypothetical protein